MMKEKIALHLSPSRLQIQLCNPNEYDSRVLLGEQGDLFFEPLLMDPHQASVEYAIDGWISLHDYLLQCMFDELSAAQFLYGLLERLKKAMQNQPAVLDLQAVYLLPEGTSLHFVRAPLHFSCWMKRKSDALGFYEDLLTAFQGECRYVRGILFELCAGRLLFDQALEGLERFAGRMQSKWPFARPGRMKAYQPKTSYYPLSAADEKSLLSLEMSESLQETIRQQQNSFELDDPFYSPAAAGLLPDATWAQNAPPKGNDTRENDPHKGEETVQEDTPLQENKKAFRHAGRKQKASSKSRKPGRSKKKRFHLQSDLSEAESGLFEAGVSLQSFDPPADVSDLSAGMEREERADGKEIENLPSNSSDRTASAPGSLFSDGHADLSAPSKADDAVEWDADRKQTGGFLFGKPQRQTALHLAENSRPLLNAQSDLQTLPAESSFKPTDQPSDRQVSASAEIKEDLPQRAAPPSLWDMSPEVSRDEQKSTEDEQLPSKAEDLSLSIEETKRQKRLARLEEMEADGQLDESKKPEQLSRPETKKSASSLRRQKESKKSFEHREKDELSLKQADRNADETAASTVMIEEMIAQAWIEFDGSRYPLEKGQVLLGRSPECDLRLIDPTISSRHAEIECANGRWYIRDLKSTNGTWIAGRKVLRKMRLKEGMHLQFGSREAEFHEC